MAIDQDKLMRDFVSESTDLLDKSEDSILSLENEMNPSVVDELFRYIHTIKGNSGLFKMPKLTQLSHLSENLLGKMRKGKLKAEMEVIDILLLVVDKLRQMIADIHNTENYDTESIISELDKLLSKEDIKKEDDAILKEKLEEKQSSKKPTNKFSIKIPGSYVKESLENNQFLVLVFLDLNNQKINDLNTLSNRITEFKKNTTILKHGFRSEISPIEEGSSLKPLPYYFLFRTSSNPKSILESYELVSEKIKIITKPKTKKQTQAENISKLNKNEAKNKKASIRNIKTKEKNSKTVNSDNTEVHLKIPLTLIDSLLNQAGETIIARNELLLKIEGISDPALTATAKKLSHLITGLQEGLMQTRLQELDTVFSRLPRLARDVANATGKKINLLTEGGDVELDKTLIDAIIDPLMHMLRNSIDHGIETPDIRIANNKNEIGTIKVKGNLRGGNVIVSISDDGAGLNIEAIKDSVLKKGSFTETQLSSMTDEEIAELVFLPGLSTAKEVSETSGRGVGMDVVKSNIKKLGGSVDISTVKNEGTSVSIVLPQTLTIITCLMIKSAGERYALPQQNISEFIIIDESGLSTVEDHIMYNLRGNLLPLVNLNQVFNSNAKDKLKNKDFNKPKYIAVVSSEKHFFGLMVDEVMNPEEIVVKPLGIHFSDVDLFAGAAIMGDGGAVLILDVAGIAKNSKLQSNLSNDIEAKKNVKQKSSSSGLLLLESSGQQFAIQVETIPRIEKIKPGQIEHLMNMEIVKYQNEVIPLIRLEDTYSLDFSEEKECNYIIIFTIDKMKIGISATEVFNVVNEIPGLHKNKFNGLAIMGHAIINNRTVIVLNIIELLKFLKEKKLDHLGKQIKENKINAKINNEKDLLKV